MDDKARSLEFTLAIGCALQCKYCPQDKLIEKYNSHICKRMTFETFSRALSQIEPGGGVIISGMAEPFHNPECATMIKYAYEKGYKVRLFTSLTGVTRDDLDIIKDVKFDEFTIHIPDQEFNSKFKITEQWQEIFDEVQKRFGEQISAYSVHGEIHSSVKKRLLNRPIADDLMDRAGNLECKGLKKISRKGRIQCMSGSKTNIGIWTPEVLPDGTVTLCCMDYSMKHVLGNIVNQNWKEIVQGSEYQKIIEGREDDTIDCLCRSCSLGVEYRNWPSTRFREKIDNSTTTEENQVINKVKQAKQIVVFGLGRLFWDQYFYGGWDEVLCAVAYSDNNPALWNTDICGVPCVEPGKISEIDGVLVVLFVKEYGEIEEQLEKLGIRNVIPIMDIYDCLGKK